MYLRFAKRLMDISLATVLLIIFLPLALLILLILLLSTWRNPIYTQQRVGRKEKLFLLFKFKTMTDLKDKYGHLAEDYLRITRVGRLLRKSSLDELPQLVNVIMGQMSLIGPRPLLVKYLDYYRPIEKKRHHIRPGLSGWAQVNGRNKTNWDQRLALDVFYVEHVSLKLDLLIIYKTIIHIIQAKDVVVEQHMLLIDLNEERKPMHNED
ncbi:sugar transferase [Pedobacter sp. ASV28]|jgi:undecaprenyl phosphate N,N'-diacetylbacillosamine 1-phosphate transferase|uniref:sugar transferase n=1 Tax=Pedobacter sp. ASV28 TaxID=2795123 RepID=UPI0018ECB187|nr:sugar transferase [Pedobacter sp. ASV28]